MGGFPGVSGGSIGGVGFGCGVGSGKFGWAPALGIRSDQLPQTFALYTRLYFFFYFFTYRQHLGSFNPLSPGGRTRNREKKQ